MTINTFSPGLTAGAFFSRATLAQHYHQEHNSGPMNLYHCLACRKLLPLVDNKDEKCPSCGGTNGEVLSSERAKEGLERRAYFNIDPKTGKRLKNKLR
jgi:hypothetical protein